MRLCRRHSTLAACTVADRRGRQPFKSGGHAMVRWLSLARSVGCLMLHRLVAVTQLTTRCPSHQVCACTPQVSPPLHPHSQECWWLHVRVRRMAVPAAHMLIVAVVVDCDRPLICVWWHQVVVPAVPPRRTFKFSFHVLQELLFLKVAGVNRLIITCDGCLFCVVFVLCVFGCFGFVFWFV